MVSSLYNHNYFFCRKSVNFLSFKSENLASVARISLNNIYLWINFLICKKTPKTNKKTSKTNKKPQILLQYTVDFMTGTSGLKIGIFNGLKINMLVMQVFLFCNPFKNHLDRVLSREVTSDGPQKLLSTSTIL